MGDKTPANDVRTYGDVLKEQQLARERDNTLKNIAEKKRQEEEEGVSDRERPTKASQGVAAAPVAPVASKVGEKRRNRWDQSNGVDGG